MQLIKSFGKRKSKTAKFPQSWGLFLCPHCNKEVERILTNGKKNNSCGCMRKTGRITHGHTMSGHRHPLYIVWALMNARCRQSKATAYHRYGGRGIFVCKAWSNDFLPFYNWALQNGWENGLELDRKDNDGDYDPNNCRFVSRNINVRNSTVAKLNVAIVAEIRGRYAQGGINYKELGKIYGVTGATISNIIRRKNWRDTDL